MKITNKLTYLTLLISPFFVAAQQNYDTDEFENFVADQEVQQSLNNAQEILCKIANMGTKDLANDGPYKATQTLTLCSQSAGGSGSSDGSAATAAVSAQSSTTASSATSGADAVVAVEIDEYSIDSQFEIDGSQVTKLWFNDDTPFDEQTNRSPKTLTYIKLKQTDGESDTKRFGDFVAQWQSYANGNRPEDFEEDSWVLEYECSAERIASGYSWCIDGTSLGEGTLIANGNAVQYRESQPGYPESNLAAEFLTNDDVKGVYTRQTGWQDESLIDPSCDGSTDWWECQSQEFRDSSVNVTGQFTFGRNAADKLFCSTLAGLSYIDWSQPGDDGEYPKREAVTLNDDVRQRLKERNWSTEEACYSVDASTTIKNVWDYGVYNENGTPYTLANPSFPIKSIVEVVENAGTDKERTVKKRIHGYASYWGVHVDESYQSLVTDTTPFKRDDLGKDDLNVDNIYNVKPRSYRIERTDKVFSALNDLDGLSLQFYVGNDEWWSQEYASLGFPAQTEFNRRIAFASNKATLTDYDNGSASNSFNHSIYGSHDGASTFNANLVGGKIDKTNLQKLLTNDASDAGKVMNFSVKLGTIPENGFDRQISPHLFLCTGSSIANAANTYGSGDITLAAGQACIMLSASVKVTSDGSALTISSMTSSGSALEIYASYFDSSGLQLQFPGGGFDLNEVYSFKVDANGIDQGQLYLDFNFGRLVSKISSTTEQGNRDSDKNGLISESLNAFLNSSNSFTFLAQSHGMNLYTHDQKRFDKIKGTFEVAATPPAAMYVDDVNVNEAVSGGSVNLTFKLTQNAATDTTVDYAIAASSTASADDYTLASTGTVTIASGSSEATLAIALTNDAVAESLTDETIVLTLSNPTNAVLGRTEAAVHIYDDDISRVSYNEYVAVFNAETATFKVEEGIKNDPYWEIVELATPFEFTVTDWLTKMKKVYNEGTEWEDTDIRDIGAWSSDTETYYRIFPSSMQNPTSTTKGVGVQSEVRTIITASELPENLYCFERCPSTALVKAHYDNAISQVSGGNSISAASPSPHIAAADPKLTAAITVDRKYNEGTDDEYTESETYPAGRYFQGQTLANMATYTINTDGLVDPDSANLSITSDFSAFTRPGDAIRGSYYTTEWGQDQTSWGIWTGLMVDATNLAKTECDKEQDGTYRDFNPRYSDSTATRYCQYKLWQSDSEVESFYNVSLETNKNYEIFDSSGTKVVFDARQTFNLVLPDDATKFGADAGKKFRLDYQGSHLGGIPGNVINKDTGENLGEWVREWKDEYRWVQRFVIPDGTVLTSRVNDTKVKVKALRGEEWLLKRDDAIGTMPTLLDYSLTELAKREDLEFEIGPRPIYWWACDSNQNGIGDEWESDQEGWEWVQDAEGNWIEPKPIDKCNDRETGEPLLFDADGNPINYPYQPEYASADQLAYYVLRNSFADCKEKNEWEIERWRADNAQRNDDDPNKYGDYTQDENFMGHFQNELDRCQTIGPVPAEGTLINDGLPAVVDGKVVFDPSPSA
jgi:hypothetical protein